VLAYNIIKADIAKLRSKHHICGVLTGTLPHLSQQNAFLGVPLILLPEEVVLLVENGTSPSTRVFFFQRIPDTHPLFQE
jgi:hypothetical protein